MRRPVPILASPAFTGAVLVLLVNDHVLKRVAPGMVTGKVSDVAGVAMVAMLLQAVLRRPTAAVAITAVAFTLLKTVGGVAAAAAPILGGTTRTDTTDLIALAVLIPLHRWFRRGADRTTGCEAASVLALQVVAVVLAVTATTATSCDSPDMLRSLTTDGTTVWAEIPTDTTDEDGNLVDGTRWIRSDDAGRTWTESLGAPPEDVGPAATTACIHSQCWRTIPEQRVEQSAAGGWTTVFEFTESEQATLRDVRNSGCGDAVTDTFGSLVAIDGASPTVLVAMGSQGVLRYDGSTWTRVAVLDLHPLPLHGATWLARLGGAAGLALGASALICLLIGAASRFWWRPPRRWLSSALPLGIGAVVVLSMMALASIGSDPAPDGVWIVAIVIAAIAFVTSVVILVRPLRPLPPLEPMRHPPPPSPER